MRVFHAINECAQFRRCNRHDVADLVRESLAGRITILDRREQSAGIEHSTIGILMVGPKHLAGEILEAAADLRQRGCAIQNETVLAFDLQRQFGAAQILDREARIEEAQERAERRGRIVVLRLAEQKRGAAFAAAIASSACALDARA